MTSLQKASKIERSKVEPGDLRANKGIIFLKDRYIPRFRQPYFQGLPESIVPLLLLRLLAGYSRRWHLSYGIAVVWLTLLLKYFTYDHNQIRLDILRQVLGDDFSKRLSYLILAAYTGLMLYLGGKTENLFFLLTIYLLTDLGIKYVPKSLTFSEAFTLATLLTVYGGYGL